MNNVKGITLTTLVITIVVLLILASVATFTGIEAIENTKRTKFIAELKIMQSYVNQWYEDCKPSVNATEYDKQFATNVKTKFTINGNVAVNATSDKEENKEKVQKAQETLTAAGITSNQDHFYLLESSQKSALGIEGVEQDVLVSVQDRKVVSYLGLKYKNQMYYTIDSIDGKNGIDAIYNVGYENPNKNPPSILVTGRSVYNGETAKGAKYKFTVDVTQGSRYINKGDLYYGKIENGEVKNWNKTEDKSFIVDREGTYKIKYKDAAGNESEEIEYQIKPKTTLISGSNFNKKMKKLSGSTSPQATTANTNITGFKIADVKPSNSILIDNNKVSTDDSQYPTYMWYDNGTIYLWSEENWIGFNSDSSNMFNNLQKAANIELSYIMDTRDVTSMENLFHNCLTLAELDVSNFNTSNVTTMKGIFSGSDTNLYRGSDYRMNLTNIKGLNSFNTSKVNDMSRMFYMCINLTSLDVSSFNTSKVKDMSQMFGGCWFDTIYYMSLTEINGIQNFNTECVENMHGMFYACRSLKTLNVSNFNTSNVKDMGAMFVSCEIITELDVSKFNTQNVTDMSNMFWRCNKLTSLDVTGFNTHNVTTMNQMFRGCSKISNLDLTGFDTQNVTNMSYMFYGCSGLTNLDVTAFNTSNVTNMLLMFYGCSSLTSLDLSSFDTSKVTTMWCMFYGCNHLQTIYVSDNFVTTALTNDPIANHPEGNTNSSHIFAGCTKLVGGAGTTYNSSNTDKTYARIDDPTNGKPGYFTRKQNV